MNSTSDVEPGEAPIAIESPKAVLSKQDLSGSHGSGAYIHVGAGGWLIALTVVASVSTTIVILMLAYGPSYIDAKVQAGIAEANATARLARAEASVALDKVGDLRDELNRKGADIPALDGH